MPRNLSSPLNWINVMYNSLLKEQYVTLTILPEMISSWRTQGFTHIHLGAIGLVLTYQGRKDLPVTARIALLDSRLLSYKQAVIGTVLTTLNSGSVVLTFFPNYSVFLNVLNLPSMLKIQLLISGTDLVPSPSWQICTINWCIGFRIIPLIYLTVDQ
jgi:hypothetical protein